MWMSRRLRRSCLAWLAAAAAACALEACARPLRSTLARPPTSAEMAELWVDPGVAGARDLLHGPGGAGLAPSPDVPYEFVQRDTGGTSPGYDVRDESGLEWSVKLGIEARAEVAASRILWAAGYHQPATYYLASWKLRRDGVVEPQPAGRFRPKLPGWQRTGFWRWHANPFVGTRPFQGLIVMMVMLSNWDLRDDNNTIYELRAPLEGARRWYVVRDLGASLGRAEFYPQGSKNDLDDFEKQGFLKGADGDRARLDFNSRRYRGLFHNIQVEDVRWACGLLGRLDDKRWDDAFRAAGYEPEQRERYIRKLAQKVAEGRALRAERAAR
jgi:hypothetical protein